MAREDLLDERGARAEQARDEDERTVGDGFRARQPFRRERGEDLRGPRLLRLPVVGQEPRGAREIAETVLLECQVVAAAIVAGLAEREVQALARDCRQVGAAQRALQPADERRFRVLDPDGMHDAHERVVVVGVQVEDALEHPERLVTLAELLLQQREVEHRRDVARVGGQRALEMRACLPVAAQFVEDHAHVGKHFLRLVDLQFERGSMLGERFLESAAAAQETGEVEPRGRELRQAADEPAIEVLGFGQPPRLLEQARLPQCLLRRFVHDRFAGSRSATHVSVRARRSSHASPRAISSRLSRRESPSCAARSAGPNGTSGAFE